MLNVSDKELLAYIADMQAMFQRELPAEKFEMLQAALRTAEAEARAAIILIDEASVRDDLPSGQR